MNKVDYTNIKETAKELAEYSQNVTAISKDERAKFDDFAIKIIDQQNQAIQLLTTYVIKLSDANDGIVNTWEQAHYLSKNKDIVEDAITDN